jgi:hypothetical protein
MCSTNFKHIFDLRDGSSMIWCGGQGALPALVPSCIGCVRCPPINILYLNCNCCSQFAYHHVITQIIVSHFLLNNEK